MKIIHCADLHLDSKIDTLQLDKTKLRREEILHSFERLCDYAKNNNVDAIIVAGDMFDTNKISLKSKRRIFHAISSISNVKFFYLSGNHDSYNIMNDEDCPKNVFTFTDNWTKFNLNGINVIGANPQGEDYSKLIDTLILDKKETNIVVMHGQVANYKSNQKGALISIPKLKNKGIDYLALGHIHYYSCNQLDERGVMVYSGCLDGRGFDETGEKGFVLLDIQNGKIEHEFIAFSSRQYFVSEYVTSANSTYLQEVDAIVCNLKEKYSSTSLVKLVIKGEHSTDYIIDVEYLANKLNEIFFYSKVIDETTLKISESDFQFDKTIRGEFVREVLKSNLTEEEKNSIILCGINSLKGEI